jgi:hypothetical protein
VNDENQKMCCLWQKNHHDILQQQMCIASGYNNGKEKEE